MSIICCIVPSTEAETGHRVKGLLHTVFTYRNIIRNVYHLAGCRFRSVTDVAHIFQFFLIVLVFAIAWNGILINFV